jgi:translation initiation factor IF-1
VVEAAVSERLKDAQVEGVVTAQLPSGLYQVEIDGPHRITAHVSAGAERNFVRVLVGDRVVLELTPRDTTRGRIVRKAT